MHTYSRNPSFRAYLDGFGSNEAQPSRIHGMHQAGTIARMRFKGNMASVPVLISSKGEIAPNHGKEAISHVGKGSYFPFAMERGKLAVTRKPFAMERELISMERKPLKKGHHLPPRNR
jgi:hypothetical protein